MFKFSYITIFLSFLIFPLFSVFAEEVIPGCQEHDVINWAWSENIGWISLSCENQNSIGEGIDYGLDIDSETGIISGYIWSENIGWISFNKVDLETANCPDYLENPENCKAWVEGSELKGWAKTIDEEYAGYYEEWISLSGVVDVEGVEEEYGIQINTVTKELDGWAWGDKTLGWIEFSYDDGSGYGGGEVPVGGEGSYISLLESDNWPDTTNNNITFSAWIYWEEVEGQEEYGIYSAITEDTLTTIQFEVRGDGGLYLGVNGNTQGVENVIKKNKWIHVVFTYNGSTKWARVYVDAEQVSSKQFNAGQISIPQEGGLHAIGISGSGRNFNGYITRARVYYETFE